MAKKCLVEEEAEWYLDKKEKALKVHEPSRPVSDDTSLVRLSLGGLLPSRASLRFTEREQA
jgi:hypothetical protein